MAEPWWICYFVYLFTDRCMQSWNAAFYIFCFFCWLFVVGGKNISVSGSQFNCATRVGSDDFSLKPVPISTVYPSSDSYFQQDNAQSHIAQIISDWFLEHDN